jgi:hypothetical protein
VAASGLRAASVAQLRPLLHAHWQRLADELVPLIEHLIEHDAQAARPDDPNRYRVRFGLYGFDDTPAADGATEPGDAGPPGPPR